MVGRRILVSRGTPQTTRIEKGGWEEPFVGRGFGNQKDLECPREIETLLEKEHWSKGDFQCVVLFLRILFRNSAFISFVLRVLKKEIRSHLEWLQIGAEG